MRKKLLVFSSYFAVIGLLLFAGNTFASRPDRVDTVETHSGQQVRIPETAIQVTPGVFNLGTVQYNGKEVQGYAFVHYKDGFAKPNNPGHGNGNGGGSTTSSCYGYLANGAKWKANENWVVNPANTQGLSSSFVLDNITSNIQKWEDAANYNILGNGSTTSATLVADTSSPDGVNEVYFGDIADPNAIGVTIVWGVFNGPPFARELVEWDQVYDDVDYSWSNTEDPTKMDFENISTHELGHAVGLADLYTTDCSQETMYGYAGNGETNKRTLEAGDIAGVSGLY